MLVRSTWIETILIFFSLSKGENVMYALKWPQKFITQRNYTKCKFYVKFKDMKLKINVYLILCYSRIPYIGGISQLINKRIQEHNVDIGNGRMRSSALAEHLQRNKH